MPLIIKKHIIMYARKYYLIIYRRNLIPEYTRTCQQQYSRTCQLAPSLFTKSHIWPFDLLTFLPFTAYTIFIKFTPFTIHLVHHINFHLFTFTFSSFPLPFPSYLHLLPSPTTSQHPGQRLKKSGTTLSFLAKMY